MKRRPSGTDPQLSQFYEEMRAKFTAADLAKYAENTPTFPFKDVIAELDEELAKTKKTGRRKSGKRGKKSA